MRLKIPVMALALLATLPLSACSTAALQALSQAAPSANSGIADLQNTVSQLLTLSSEQQTQLARTINSQELLDWSSQNQSSSNEAKQTSATTLLQSKPQLSSLLANRFKNQTGQVGMGPGGLPPNFAELQNKYPELAKALASMQNLGPEERRIQMDALFQAHPEWQTALAPPHGMGGPGGPIGSPPPGFVPGGAPPPLPLASPSAAAESK